VAVSAPDLAIVLGAMKAGTTTLFQRLGSHPRVARSTPKEPGFFSRDEHWSRGYDWYRDRWPGDLGDRVRLEATTGYTMLPRFPATFERMETYLAEEDLEARFVYSLRDPIERIRSHLTHWRAGAQEAKLFDHDRGAMSGHVLGVSMYARQLDAFLDRFERSRLKLVRFEELASDTETVLADVATFLGLDPDQLGGGEAVHNPSTGKYRKSRAWEMAETLGLDRLTDVLPEDVLDPVRGSLGDPIEAKIELDEAKRASYLRALATDLRRLRDEHDVAIDGWTLPPGLAR
jgi:hypothetical protein